MTVKPTRIATAKAAKHKWKTKTTYAVKQYLNMNKLNINNQQTLALTLTTYILL